MPVSKASRLINRPAAEMADVRSSISRRRTPPGVLRLAVAALFSSVVLPEISGSASGFNPAQPKNRSRELLPAS